MDPVNKKRPARRQAYTGRYPVWGLEEPRFKSNARELYRYSEQGFFTRYIVPPSDVIDKRRIQRGKRLLGVHSYELLKYGYTIGDLTISLLVAAWVCLLFYAAAFGSWIDVLGV